MSSVLQEKILRWEYILKLKMTHGHGQGTQAQAVDRLSLSARSRWLLTEIGNRTLRLT